VPPLGLPAAAPSPLSRIRRKQQRVTLGCIAEAQEGQARPRREQGGTQAVDHGRAGGLWPTRRRHLGRVRRPGTASWDRGSTRGRVRRPVRASAESVQGGRGAGIGKGRHAVGYRTAGAKSQLARGEDERFDSASERGTVEGRCGELDAEQPSSCTSPWRRRWSSGTDRPGSVRQSWCCSWCRGSG